MKFDGCEMAKRLKGLKMDDFVLVGHDRLYGEYPAPVIPIGRRASALVAVYPGGEGGPTVECLDEPCAYVRYGPKLQKKLAGFDALTERLFAFSDTDVDRYAADREREFLGNLLKQKRFHNAKEEIRRMLAERTEELALARR